MRTGFDNEKYLRMQSEHIRQRIEQFDRRNSIWNLARKLFDDYHASRVLPGFEPDSKLLAMPLHFVVRPGSDHHCHQRQGHRKE